MNAVESRPQVACTVVLLTIAVYGNAPERAALGRDPGNAASHKFEASSQPDVREIAAAVKESRERIVSIHVRHTNTSHFIGVDRPATRTTTFRFQDGMAFVDTQDGSGAVNQVRPLDRERARLYFDGQTFYKLWREDRIVLEHPIDKSAPFMLKQQYLDGLAMWPFSSAGLSPISTTTFYLPAALENNPYGIVARRDETTGAACTVLECLDVGPSHFEDRIWLDESRNWALRKRVTRAKHSPNRQDSKMSILLDDYREMEPGIWMPWRIETAQFRRLQGDAEKFESIARDVLVVDEMTINRRIARSAYRPEYQPGALVRRLDTGVERVMPGGVELLESAGANLGGVVRRQARERSRTLGRTLEAARYVPVFAVACALGGGLFAVVRRAWKPASLSRNGQTRA